MLAKLPVWSNGGATPTVCPAIVLRPYTGPEVPAYTSAGTAASKRSRSQPAAKRSRALHAALAGGWVIKALRRWSDVATDAKVRRVEAEDPCREQRRRRPLLLRLSAHGFRLGRDDDADAELIFETR